MMESIVVGTDGSAHADLAVDWAADEAALWQRPLHIVHAAGRWEYDLPFYTAPGLSESLTDTGERILAQAADRAVKARPGLRITTELIFDAPVRALRAFAGRAHEVVVGHRGLGGFAGTLLGSTALRVAGHMRGPVIVVRGRSQERRGEVVVGIDGSDESEVALRYAFEAATARGARVRAVHSWRVPVPMFTGAYPVTANEAAALARDRLAGVVAPWKARFPGVKVVEEAPCGQAVQGLTDRSGRAALLVVGSRGLGGLKGLYLGSVGHGLIHHADCPVAVVRALQ